MSWSNGRFFDVSRARRVCRWASCYWQLNMAWLLSLIASHPCRQLGSSSWSILCRKELRWWWPVLSLWRHIAVRLLWCWCHFVMPILDFVVTHFFWQRFRVWSRFSDQLGFIVEMVSLGDSRMVALFPFGMMHSSDASRSAVSFPSIPVWLGIHARVVRVR